MNVQTYDEKTKQRIVDFLKQNKQAIQSEIVRLGSEKRVINWQTLKIILEDLQSEGKISRTCIGNQVILYEWRG